MPLNSVEVITHFNLLGLNNEQLQRLARHPNVPDYLRDLAQMLQEDRAKGRYWDSEPDIPQETALFEWTANLGSDEAPIVRGVIGVDFDTIGQTIYRDSA